jgi:hypothetical protein
MNRLCFILIPLLIAAIIVINRLEDWLILFYFYRFTICISFRLLHFPSSFQFIIRFIFSLFLTFIICNLYYNSQYFLYYCINTFLPRENQKKNDSKLGFDPAIKSRSNPTSHSYKTWTERIQVPITLLIPCLLSE